MANVGLTINEGVASGATAYREPAKRNVGLIGQFIRGASFSPTRITSMEEFSSVFGGQSASFFGPGIVKSIFDEAKKAPVVLYIARVVGSDSVVANGSVSLSGDATMSIRAGYKGKDDHGAWANGVKASLYSFGYKIKGMFTLEVEYNGAKEVYSYPTLSQIQSAVNRVSKFITVEFSEEIEKTTLKEITGTVTASTSSNKITGEGTSFETETPVGTVIFDSNGKQVGTVAAVESDTSLTLVSRAMVDVESAAIKKREDKVYTATLASGADGEVSEQDFYPVKSATDPKGLACFDGYDVQIIACTEFHTLTMAKVLNQYLNERKNPVGVINLPLNADEGTAELYALELQTNETSFISGYLGWCKVPDSEGNPMLIPAIGPVIGAGYIRTPFLQGDFIHIPPAGTDSLFATVTEVIPPRIEQATINRLVQQFSCNIIQYIDNEGYYVGTSRTYSTNDLYSSVHIRLQTSYYTRALYAKLRFTEQKPNTPELKREILVELNSYFKNEYDNGALERSVSFNTAYKQICDLSNNPVGQSRKILNITAMFIPTECTESIVLDLQRNDGILTVTEQEG